MQPLRFLSADSMRRGDIFHFGLMVSALALAYLLPFELVLLSYVVLGPLHYLTEISWLHDRKYFLPHRGVALALTVAALAASFVQDASWFGIIVWGAFVICALLAVATTALQGMLLLMAAGVATLVIASQRPGFAIVGVLLPTLIHVLLFTLVFMVVGAHKARSRVQFGLAATYVASLILILTIPPSAATVIPTLAALARDSFGNVPQALGRLLSVPDLALDARLTGLLSFVYTYHYLNWFIKADVIRWTDIPRRRLAGIIALSVAATSLYFYDYVLGFAVLLSLSLIHVLLEFPLNSLSLRQLGAITGRALIPNRAAAPGRVRSRRT